jgi:hypothetical protein
MRTDSRVIVLEALLPPGNAFHIGKLLDMNSLVLAGGPDRDACDLLALLSAAGLEHRRVLRTATLAIVEAALAQ